MSRVIGILALVAVFAFLQCGGTPVQPERESFFLAQVGDQLVAIIKSLDEQSGASNCQIFTDPFVVKEVKKITSDDEIHHLSLEEMEEIRKVCEEDKGFLKNEEERKLGIYPGTKWCGAGDEAENYDDLGSEAGTDRCCRDHDHCDDLIEAGESKHNLYNWSPITSLSCKCDNQFYDCLHQVNTTTSNQVGRMYFSYLRRQCYAENYPQICKEYYTRMEIACKVYERDTTKPKVYEWVNAKYYNPW